MEDRQNVRGNQLLLLMLISYQGKMEFGLPFMCLSFLWLVFKYQVLLHCGLKIALFPYYLELNFNHTYFCTPIIYFGEYAFSTFSINDLCPSSWVLSDFIVSLVCISSVLKGLSLYSCVYLLFIIFLLIICTYLFLVYIDLCTMNCYLVNGSDLLYIYVYIYIYIYKK